jgi:hypothetical protein
MPGSRKVRVFLDRKKSPNWYVEWRDEQGRRRAESCGPDRADADQRAQQIRQELRAARLTSTKTPPITASPSIVTNLVRLHARITLGEYEVPAEISIELTPDLLRLIRRHISLANEPD